MPRRSKPRAKNHRAASRRPQALEPDPVIETYKKDVDRTLLRENLKLSVEGRLLKLIQLQELAEELRRAGRTR